MSEETNLIGWQDISTAPDGASILLRLSNGEVFSGWATTENDGSRTWQRFHATSADVGWLNAKHWSPMLPEPGTPSKPDPQTNAVGVMDTAECLCQRLEEFERGLDDDDVVRQYYGHVHPAFSRLVAALAKEAAS